MKYNCEHCDHSQDTPGTCPSCGVELKEETTGTEAPATEAPATETPDVEETTPGDAV